MELISDFKKLNKSDVILAGGKGASLGEMTRSDIPVPPGFVVLSTTFDKFIEGTDLNVEIDSILHSVNHKEMHTVENASEEIQALILGAEMPKDIAIEIQKFFKKLDTKYIAVRSSATAEDSANAAWAGQLDSFLNTTQESLLENVKKCWASLFTPRAIFYRFEKELHKQKISVAVVVQKMIQSEVSGIAFSVHPVTQDRNQLIIEAGLGLGEAIVSGQITPDSYVVEKEPRRIIDKNVSLQKRGLFKSEKGGNEWKRVSQEQGGKQTLTDEQILELSEIVLHIENHYGFPCDIEWAFEKGKFYVVQSRPITTLTPNEEPNKQDSKSEKKREFKFMWGQKQSAMISEGMMWQLMRTFNSKGEFALSGIPETLFIMKDGIFEHFMPTNSYDHIAKDGAKYLKKSFSLMLFRTIVRHIKSFFSFAEKIRKKDFSKAPNNELYDIVKKYETFFDKTFVFFGTSSNWWTDTLTIRMQAILVKYVSDSQKRDEYFINLCTPAEVDETMRERLEFSDLVQKYHTSQKDLENYARRFPALFFNTYDTDEVQKFLASRARDEQSKDFKEEKERIMSSLSSVKEKQKKIYKEIPDPLLKYFAQTLQKSALNRYRLKHIWSGGEYLFLNLFKELQRRIEIPFDDFVKTYTFTDIKNFLQNGEVLSVKERENRKICFVMHSKDGVVHLVNGKEALGYIASLLPEARGKQETAGDIRGQIANKGIIRGYARVVFVKDLKQFLHDSKQFKKGEILVTTMTSPVMIPLIEKAAGIITDEGGICSHAAISAREFNIPCIIGTHGASSKIKTGDHIEVNANNGIIRILK